MAPIGLPKALLAVRRLTRLTRYLSWQWCRVPIAEPHALPSASESGPGTWTWSIRALGQSATWRDAVWMMFVVPVASPLLLLPLVAPACLGWYWPLPASHDKKPAVLALLGVATVASVYAGPSLLKGYGLLARSVLGPTTQAELARRVRHLAETRSESLDASAAELRRTSATSTTAPRPVSWPWA